MRLVLIGLLLSCGFVSAEASEGRRSCTVARVSDGDTLRCADGTRVRLLLVDAPEMKQGEPGRRARAVLEELAPIGATLTLELDVQEQDRYGRLLAYVHRDGAMLNEVLAQRGFVLLATYPPNVRHVDRIRTAVALARRERRGLWSGAGFDCRPQDFRQGRCAGKGGGK